MVLHVLSKNKTSVHMEIKMESFFFKQFDKTSPLFHFLPEMAPLQKLTSGFSLKEGPLLSFYFKQRKATLPLT